MGAESFWLPVGADALRVDCSGTGPETVVLLHELGGTLHSWDRVAPDLAQGRRVVCYDARGAGLSSRIDGGIGIDRLVEDLAAVVEHCCAGTRLVLMGTAVGAGVITAFLARFPTRAAGAILTSPALGVVPDRRLAVREAAARCRVLGFRAIAETELAASYPEELRSADPEAFALYRARFQSNDAASFAAHLEMLADLDLAPVLPGLDLPLLILNGTLDPLRPPAHGHRLAASCPSASARDIRSGHFMAWQTPAPFLAEVETFLASLRASAS